MITLRVTATPMGWRVTASDDDKKMMYDDVTAKYGELKTDVIDKLRHKYMNKGENVSVIYGK